jgi:hypothetical protein
MYPNQCGPSTSPGARGCSREQQQRLEASNSRGEAQLRRWLLKPGWSQILKTSPLRSMDGKTRTNSPVSIQRMPLAATPAAGTYRIVLPPAGACLRAEEPEGTDAPALSRSMCAPAPRPWGRRSLRFQAAGSGSSPDSSGHQGSWSACCPVHPQLLTVSSTGEARQPLT